MHIATGFMLAVLLLWTTLGHAANAADERLLQVTLSPVTLRPRTAAIQHLDAHIDWRGAGLLRGRIELVVTDGVETRFVCHSPELALVRGEQTLRLTLPPAAGTYGDAQLDIRVAFLAGDRRLPLGGTVIGVSSLQARDLIVAVVSPPTDTSPHDELVRSLQLERYRPAGQGELLRTSLARVRPEAMPPHALGYTAFDLVTIAGAALPDLGPEAVAQLGAWLRGGGSVAVLLDGPVPPEHVEALNRWAGEAGSPRRLTVDAAGRPAADTPAISLLRVGLGRLVVVAGPVDLASPEWRGAVAFLWKLRPVQRQALVAHEAWRADVEERSANHYGPYGYNPYGEQLQQAPVEGETVVLAVQPLPTTGGHELVAGLMPISVSVVPFGLIVLILAGFTIAVGPVDYLALGLIRRRRWTWAVFPVIAVGFTAATVALSNRYMGSTDHRTTLEIADVGRGGRLLRESRFDLLFAGRPTDADDAAEDALLTPVNHEQLGSTGYYYDPYGQAASRAATPVYVGRVPSSYRLHQQVGQWTPRLSRSLQLPPGDAVDDTLQWDRVTIEDLRKAAAVAGVNPLVAKLTGSEPFRGSIYLFHGKMRQVLYGPANPLTDRIDPEMLHWSYPPNNVSGPGLNHESLLSQVCARQREGFFSLVSRISPTGGESLEDLAVLDDSDEDEWLVAAVWREGGTLRMVRRLYRE